MNSSTIVDAARKALGPVGVLLPISFTSAPSAELQRAAVGRLERAGYRAAWTNEAFGKDALVQLSILLAATERMTFGTGIANIWVREPQTAHGAAALLAQAYPDRFVLGLGVGYPEQAATAGREFGRPLTTLRDYLARMTAPTFPPAPDAAYPRILGANGPRMLALAAEIADGALPSLLPAAFTAHARQVLGPDKLLVASLAVHADADAARARTAARETVTGLLARPAYVAALRELGYSAEELEQVGDALVDSIVAHPDPAAIAAAIRAHLAAGADHVMLMTSLGGDYATGIAQLERIAPEVTEIS
ncbi:TIGR03620 family F420-dependent LLM class oxidoreductase [Nocardia terpenica]|uniref:TIGR03620 family F420-dependent LLM class oxidoreductase n=1 Tax=Nocardia terpenica TaxID=455432 RepID=UPI002FDF7635